MVFPPTEVNMKRVIRAFFVFLWGSKMERCKREIMCKPKEKGGKGMVDVRKFLYSKYLLLCVKNCKKENLWSSFIRYAAGFILAKQKWFDISLKSPVCFKPPKFYEILKKIILLCGIEEVTFEDLIKKDFLKRKFEKNEILMPIYRLSENKVKSVWSRVSHKSIFNSQKDLAWSCIHECLTTRFFQHRRGLIARAKCPRHNCCEDETVMHVMWNCSFAQKFWEKMGSLLKNIGGLNFLNYEAVLYGEMVCPSEDLFLISWKIINCGKEIMEN
ncbi:hypothetical protein XENTR_v10022099 [Xenopus tropicalis]|nr:hypothetical protein XENTR_v10022099 [Xenopus tropicalis]